MISKDLVNDCLQNAMENGDDYTVITTNGYQLHGLVLSFDAEAILMDTDKGQKLVFLHAVSTIVSPFEAPVF